MATSFESGKLGTNPEKPLLKDKDIGSAETLPAVPELLHELERKKDRDFMEIWLGRIEKMIDSSYPHNKIQKENYIWFIEVAFLNVRLKALEDSQLTNFLENPIETEKFVRTIELKSAKKIMGVMSPPSTAVSTTNLSTETALAMTDHNNRAVNVNEKLDVSEETAYAKAKIALRILKIKKNLPQSENSPLSALSRFILF